MEEVLRQTEKRYPLDFMCSTSTRCTLMPSYENIPCSACMHLPRATYTESILVPRTFTLFCYKYWQGKGCWKQRMEAKDQILSAMLLVLLLSHLPLSRLPNLRSLLYLLYSRRHILSSCNETQLPGLRNALISSILFEFYSSSYLSHPSASSGSISPAIRPRKGQTPGCSKTKEKYRPVSLSI